jgi:MFS transporter, NNP family, nitrate/nitrite transporter
MLVGAAGYYCFTQDRPNGEHAPSAPTKAAIDDPGRPGFMEALTDHRVLALALLYGASFGVEITIHNIAALYFVDTFHVGLKGAGLIVGLFGLLAIFARTLGGYTSDQISRRFGLGGRTIFLGAALLAEGLMLMLFSQSATFGLATFSLLTFGLFVHVACGATYAIIPFVNPRAVGSVAGIAGAGGNVGAVLCGFLFRGAVPWPTALLVLGIAVSALSTLALLVRFAPEVGAHYGSDLSVANTVGAGASPASAVALP